MMRRLFLLLMTPIFFGCSTLQHYEVYRYSGAANAPDVTSSCQKKNSALEKAIIQYDIANEIEVYFVPQGGVQFFGPLIFPLVPWWSRDHLVEISVISSPAVAFSEENWIIESARGSVSAHHIMHSNSVSCPEDLSLKDRLKEPADSRCISNRSDVILFNDKAMVDSIELVVRGIKINGVLQAEKRIPFKLTSAWTYEAVGPWNPQKQPLVSCKRN